MHRRTIAWSLVAVVVVLFLGVLAWPSDPGRTDRILDVYAKQLGLTHAEAREHRNDALAVADTYCSVEPDDLRDFLGTSTSPVEDMMAYAEAACPDRAQEFTRVLDEPDIPEGDLRVIVDTELPVEEARTLAGEIARVPGVAGYEGVEDGVVVQLRAGADLERTASQLEALVGVLRVERA